MRKRTLEELKARQTARPRRRMPVVVLLENVRSMFNVGAFFRTSDGAGAEQLILTGFTAHPPRREIAKVALGAEETLPWEHVKDPIEAARAVKARGYRLIAVELTTHSRNLYCREIPFPCCLVFGHEVDGISEALLGECDEAVEVPMQATKESLNVAVCGGVVLFEVRRQFDHKEERAVLSPVQDPGETMVTPILPNLRETFGAVVKDKPRRFLAHAPGRLNVIGEHTDYNGLPVLPFAIDAGIQILFAPRNEPRVALHALDFPNTSPAEFAVEDTIPPSEQGHWINYVKAAVQDGVRVAGERGMDPRGLRGFRGVVAGNVPRSAGLSSSSALVVASALAFYQGQGWPIEPASLAVRCAAAEHYVGTRGGGMDQTTSLCGKKNACLKMYFHPLEVTPVPVRVACSFLVADSQVVASKSAGVRHQYNQRVLECRLLTELLGAALQRQGTIDQPLNYLGDLRRYGSAERIDEWKAVALEVIPEQASLRDVETRIGKERLQALLHPAFTEVIPALPGKLPLRRRARYLFDEWGRVEQAARVLEAGDLEGLGALLFEAHAGLAADYEVSHPRVDELIALAGEFGLPGARMVGAGFGGATIHLVPHGQEEDYTAFLAKRFYGETPPHVRGRSVFVFHPEAGATVREEPTGAGTNRDGVFQGPELP